MSSGRLLVMALSFSGPIPNAASINSHCPDYVLLIRLKPEDSEGEDKLDDSLGRLKAWRDGELKEYFDFDTDIDLPFSPEKPSITPVIETIEAKGVSSSSKKITDEILRICDSSGIREVRIDTTAGRKEDAAGLSRLSGVTDLGSAWTVWYTDVHTGISVEIGGNLAEENGACLGHFDRMWMNASPVTDIKRTVLTDSIRGDLLTSVLNAVEKVVRRDVPPLQAVYEKCTLDELLEKCKERKLQNWGVRERLVGHLVAEDKRQLMIKDLDDRGIGLKVDVAKNYLEFYQTGAGSTQTIMIPDFIFDETDGRWLEDIVALAIAEAWDCDRTLVGLNIGHPEKEERMAMVNGLKKSVAGRHAAKAWSDCKAAGILDARFSGLDFFDVDSFDLDEYKESLHEENESEISAFVEWMFSDWSSLTKELREELTRAHKIRDLDVFAETSSHTLFVECKLSPGGTAATVEGNIAQIGSLVSRVAVRGIDYSILAHNKLDLEVYHDREFDYVLPWSMLRQPDEMLKAVINKGIPKKWKIGKRSPGYLATAAAKEALRVLKRRTRGKKREKGWDGWTPTSQDPPPPTDKIPGGNYYCPECMDSFVKWNQLKEHCRDKRHSMYECEQCQEPLLSNNEVERHSKDTGHKKISGTCYNRLKLWVPWGEDTDAQERLKEIEIFDKAIENHWDAEQFSSEVQRETGKSWREVYGAKTRKGKVWTYFNDIKPGFVYFSMGADGRWYAVDTVRGDDEE